MKNQENKSTGISRREALVAGAAGVGVLSLRGAAALAQPTGKLPKTPPKDAPLTEREVTYSSGETQIRAFLAQPQQQPKAAIIIIHEFWGLSAHIRDVARRFARQGYATLAPNLYTREGDPKIDLGDRDGLMKFLASIPDRRMTGDLEAAIEYLNGQGFAKVGSVGFCMGGLYSYLLATHSDKLQAAADFYGRISYAQLSENKPESPLDLAPQLKCPLLCCFGEGDKSIPQTDVEKLREGLAQSTQPWKINVYPGAGHAFFNDTRPSYNAAAAADAGTEVLKFFKNHLS